MYDEAYVHTVTTDELAPSNGLVSNGRLGVHKVVVQSATSNAVLAVAVYDALTVTGTAKIGLTTTEFATNAYTRYAEANFDPPVVFSTGLTSDITGTGTVRIYYSR